MTRSFDRRTIGKTLRDFTCAFVAFTALFVALAPSSQFDTPIPVLSLLSSSPASAADLSGSPAASSGGHFGLQTGFNRPPLLSPVNMPLISTVLALVFSTIVAFNLALLRHLRRVNASSRRGAWKEG